MQQLPAVSQDVFLHVLHFPITQLQPTTKVNECLIQHYRTMAVFCALLPPNKVSFIHISCNIFPVFVVVYNLCASELVLQSAHAVVK